MEFKFACKWFEISFSGDPGYVEAQLEKYEPFVLEVLKGMDLSAAQLRDERPVKDQRRQAGREDRGRRDFRGRKGRPDERGAARESDHKPGREFSSPQEPGPDAAGGSRGQSGARAEPEEPSCEAPRPEPAVEFPKRRRPPRIDDRELVKVTGDKKPRTHHDRVMVFGHYMENQGAGSDFTVEEIQRCYKATGVEAGTSIEQVINHATRSGFIARFDKSKKARFKLTNKGRRYVEDGLKLA